MSRKITTNDDNIVSKTVTFHSRRPLCIKVFTVRTGPTTGRMDNTEFWEAVGWLRAAYPVPNVHVYDSGLSPLQELQTCHQRIDTPLGPIFIPYPCYGAYEMADDGWKVLASLVTLNVFTDDSDICADQVHYVAIVHPNHDSGNLNGQGQIGGWETWVKLNEGGSPDWYVPRGGATLAHEIGHNLDRWHVDCGDPDDDTLDGGYPYDLCNIGPDDPRAYYGLKADSDGDLRVITPSGASDLMSYGFRRWMSDYTYRALYGRLAVSQGSRGPTSTAQVLAQAAELLVVTGVVTPTEGTGELGVSYRMPQGTLSASTVAQAMADQAAADLTGYTVQLVDGESTVLVEQPFEPMSIMDHLGPQRPFLAMVPYHEDTTRVLLMRAGTELASQVVSAHRPTVRMVYPNGGETITGSLTVEWEAQDEDEDSLLYTVQYSADDGTTWRALATDHVTNTLEVDTYALPGRGGAALLRVLATDGFNTAIAEVDAPFSVEGHAPRVYIIRPSDTTAIAPQMTLELEGHALDTEDGMLTGASLVWTSDHDVILGAGEQLIVSDLSPGWHTITLEAVDSDFQRSTASVDVLVTTEWLWLPLIMRSR